VGRLKGLALGGDLLELRFQGHGSYMSFDAVDIVENIVQAIFRTVRGHGCRMD
jgi:hypothetical protein